MNAAKYTDWEAHAREIAAERDRLYDALEKIWGFIDDGTLVRNTAADRDPGWAMKQLPLVAALHCAQKALAHARGEKK